MLFTQQFQIPENGRYRIGTIGGEPYETDRDGKQYQIGYMVPPRLGVVRVDGVERNDPNVLACRVSVEGYAGRPIDNARAPARVVVEMPCSVSIVGPPGTSIIVEAWQVLAVRERGAARSYFAEGAPLAGSEVPPWAQAFDFSGEGGTATFRDPGGAVVGVVSAPLVGFTVPDGAASVDITTGETISFRQN